MENFKPYFVLDSYRMPNDVVDDMSDMWCNNELGNDWFYVEWAYQNATTYPALAKYIEDHRPDTTTPILIHYSW